MQSLEINLFPVKIDAYVDTMTGDTLVQCIVRAPVVTVLYV